ncbi:unnamed protein product, partial [Hymenolepis diminuta]
GEGDKGEEDTLSKPTPSAVLIPVGVAESETESTAHDMGKEVDIGKVAEEPQGMEGDIGEVSDAEVEETLHVTSNEELPSLTEDAKDEVKEEPRTEEQITKTSSDNISYSSENNFNRDAGSEEAKTLPKEVDETRATYDEGWHCTRTKTLQFEQRLHQIGEVENGAVDEEQIGNEDLPDLQGIPINALTD